MALINCPECKDRVSDLAPACPHCGFPLSKPACDQPTRARHTFSPGRAAAAIAFPWLFALIIASSLPRYAASFDRWPASWGELPPLTQALMPIGRFGTWPIVLSGLGLVAVLVGGGVGWVRAGLPRSRIVVSILSLAGVAACVACLVGTLGQIVTAPVGRL